MYDLYLVSTNLEVKSFDFLVFFVKLRSVRFEKESSTFKEVKE
jgi:hypothetical protein